MSSSSSSNRNNTSQAVRGHGVCQVPCPPLHVPYEVLFEYLQMKNQRNTAAVVATMWPGHKLSLYLFDSSVLSLNPTPSASSGTPWLDQAAWVGQAGQQCGFTRLGNLPFPSILSPPSSDYAWEASFFSFFKSQRKLK